MSSIQVLDAVTIGHIAAGEIIERPQSVVKELVENAIDAGAMRVTVEVDGGGLTRIAVADDGAGIVPQELPIAVRAHATSKLLRVSDLESIATLGFRGEGLASIASVARLELISRTPDAPLATSVVAHEEAIGRPQPVAASPGTQAIVTELFARVPARREFLRSPSAEFTRISSWLSTFALAYPQVAFTLRHDGKDVWIMPSCDDARERLAMVFGRDAGSTLIPLESDAARMLGGRLRGYISAAGNERGDRRMQLLFVNGRLLRSTLLAGAWTAGYSTFAMIGRHPYGVLMLDLEPGHVDPNVHPTKSDVRLRFGNQVFDAVRNAIAATLRNHASQRFREATIPAGISFSPSAIGAASAPASLFDGAPEPSSDVPAHRLRVLAQLHHTFILATDGDGLLLVDQHAAHERIAYESIVERARGGAPSEPLLVPFQVELDAQQSVALDRALDVLREGGLEIEAFGPRAYRILAVPAGYGARSFDIQGLLDDLTGEPKQRDVRERLWASLACHSVCVAGERLEPQEMTTLVERLQVCGNPMHCPHGRPTMVRLTADAIAKLFKRT
jgi:DNA mismatch repair protein MutL